MSDTRLAVRLAIGFVAGCFVSAALMYCGLAAGGGNAYLSLSLAVGAVGLGLAQWPVLGVFVLLPFNRRLALISCCLLLVNFLGSLIIVLTVSSIADEISLFSSYSGLGLGIYLVGSLLVVSRIVVAWQRTDPGQVPGHTP